MAIQVKNLNSKSASTTILKKSLFAGLILSSWLLPTSSFAQSSELFAPLTTTELQKSLKLIVPNNSKQTRNVKLNQDIFDSKSIQFDLFGKSVTAVRKRIELHKKGQTTWVGHIEGSPTDSVVITQIGNVVSGFIQNQDQLFQLGHTNEHGIFQFYELSVTSIQDEEDDNLPQGGGVIPNIIKSTDNGDIVQQDLLVVYTQDACDYAGSCAQLEADINTAISDLNTSYSESDIDITMNIVGLEFTGYVEGSRSSATMLDHLQDRSDGKMDGVHALRDSLGADLVSLIHHGDGCGRAYLNADADTAFNITDANCLVGNRTLAHEIGHNQGARHNRKNDSTGDYSTGYNYGFRRCNDSSDEDLGAPYFRTTMSYSCSSASRIGRFSNPDVTYLSVPQGIDPDDGDPLKGAWNTRALNESADYIASFRTLAFTIPDAPTNLSASLFSPDAIELNWTDNATDEIYYNVEVSENGIDWDVTAQLEENATNYKDKYLYEGTTYYYRVNAQNSKGVSAYSNVVSETTEALPPVNETPIADFTYDCSELECTFDGYLSFDPDGTITSYTWDFGDGGTGTGEMTSYSFTAPGEYEISLTVMDDGGAKDETLETIIVGDPNIPPIARWWFRCEDLTCLFAGGRSEDEDGEITRYYWWMEPGTAIWGANPSITYTFDDYGVYRPFLTVRDDDGDNDRKRRRITLTEPGSASNPTGVIEGYLE